MQAVGRHEIGQRVLERRAELGIARQSRLEQHGGRTVTIQCLDQVARCRLVVPAALMNGGDLHDPVTPLLLRSDDLLLGDARARRVLWVLLEVVHCVLERKELGIGRHRTPHGGRTTPVQRLDGDVRPAERLHVTNRGSLDTGCQRPARPEHGEEVYGR